ncbi:hypothetical protein GY45DRAFT_1331006 [Cubamyces sp. BRFM 1775]|nr:hypothetical protein GY45DRAFT_1331006 [Cubamyces sp. BRFM 1775]
MGATLKSRGHTSICGSKAALAMGVPIPGICTSVSLSLSLIPVQTARASARLGLGTETTTLIHRDTVNIGVAIVMLIRCAQTQARVRA